MTVAAQRLGLRITTPDSHAEIDDPERNTQVKRRDYAEARIPEYWIVNPLDKTITVLTLTGVEYAEHGVFHRGQQAESAALDGFALSVADVFDAA